MIAVIQSGNTGSVLQALRYLGADARATEKADALPRNGKISALVLPGNGNFGSVVCHLKERGWAEYLKAWIGKDLPFLGICVGLQVLFSESEEPSSEDINRVADSADGVALSGNCMGLGILNGTIRKFRAGKVPLIGWNKTLFAKSGRYYPGKRITREGEPDSEYYYYLHSYYADCSQREGIAATAFYGVEYCSCIERGALTAVQFHPEKSGNAGLAFLKQWMEANHAR